MVCRDIDDLLGVCGDHNGIDLLNGHCRTDDHGNTSDICQDFVGEAAGTDACGDNDHCIYLLK